MKTFFISDTHFHHANILHFTTNGDTDRLRPSFQSVEAMNRYMVERWNSVVTPDDKVYHLGDVTISSSTWALDIIAELNGRKVLIKGNHDRAKVSAYMKHFVDIRSEIHMKMDEWKVVFTHRPIIPASYELNVHGHTHHRVIDSPSHLNVSVERIEYTPIEWGEVQRRLRSQIASTPPSLSAQFSG